MSFPSLMRSLYFCNTVLSVICHPIYVVDLVPFIPFSLSTILFEFPLIIFIHKFISFLPIFSWNFILCSIPLISSNNSFNSLLTENNFPNVKSFSVVRFLYDPFFKVIYLPYSYFLKDINICHYMWQWWLHQQSLLCIDFISKSKIILFLTNSQQFIVSSFVANWQNLLFFTSFVIFVKWIFVNVLYLVMSALFLLSWLSSNSQ